MMWVRMVQHLTSYYVKTDNIAETLQCPTTAILEEVAFRPDPLNAYRLRVGFEDS